VRPEPATLEVGEYEGLYCC